MPTANYLENALMNHTFRSTTFTKPSTIAIALCTAAPADTDDGSSITEVANSNAYARVDLGAPADADWSDPSAGTIGEITNAAAITFPQASGSWGTVTHIAVLDSTTHGAGNLLWYQALAVSQAISSGQQFALAIGDLALSFGGAASNYLRNAWLNHTFRTGSFSQPTTVAVGLTTAAPVAASTGATITEVPDSNSYARVDLGAPADADWSAPTAGTQGEIDNAADIQFPTASGGWGTITHFALLDSDTHGAGNLLAFGTLDSSESVISGNAPKFSAGALNVQAN